MITLKIDNRETKLKDLLIIDDVSVSIVFENLQYADYIYEIDDIPIMFIERKTLNDLASSIKDNRFTNQKNALLANVDRKSIYYIIEGDMHFCDSSLSYSGISMTALQSCIINTMIRDDIKVIISKNIEDTVTILKAIAARLLKNPEKYTNQTTTNTTEQVRTKYKASMLGKDKFFENVLLQIPGVAIKTAKALVDKFQSLDKLYSTMLDKTTEEKINILSSVTTQDTKGKNRKISSKVVDNVIEYIF
jgi:ERCC4-type nuclease